MDETTEENYEARVVDKPLPPIKREPRVPAVLDPLTAYLNEVRKYEELSPEEEHELAVRYRETGDPGIAYRLITSNLSLVVKIALTFKREWQNLMDLVQEGNIGLMKAVKNFDPFRNVRLPAYAAWWIKAYILKYLLDNWRLVRVGTTNTRRKLLYNLRKEKENLERQGFVATPKLLASHFGVDEQEVIDVEAGLGAADVSVDAPLGGEDSPTPLQFLSDGSHPETEVESDQFRRVLREKVARFLENAKPIERDLVELRILADAPLALKDIGEKYGVTREAVRQSEQRLLKKLAEYLKEYMPDAASEHP